MKNTSLRTPTLAALAAAALLAGCATEMSERQKGTATGKHTNIVYPSKEPRRRYSP